MLAGVELTAYPLAEFDWTAGCALAVGAIVFFGLLLTMST
jgi:hypothetical protein